MQRKPVKIPDKTMMSIAANARNLIDMHRTFGSKTISLDTAQKILRTMGELTAQEIFQNAMEEIERLELKKEKKI